MWMVLFYHLALVKSNSYFSVFPLVITYGNSFFRHSSVMESIEKREPFRGYLNCYKKETSQSHRPLVSLTAVTVLTRERLLTAS